MSAPRPVSVVNTSRPASAVRRRQLLEQTSWQADRERGDTALPRFMVRALVTAAETLGLSADGLNASRHPLEHGLARVAEREILADLETLRVRVGDDALGVRLGSALTDVTFGVYAPIIAVATSMRQCVESHLHIARLVPYVPPWQLWQTRGRVYFGRRQTSCTPADRMLSDMQMAAAHHFSTRFWGERARTHLQTEFAFSPPADRTLYERVFGTTVRFDSELTTFSYPVHLLDWQRPHADPSLASAVIDATLDQIPIATHWADRVANFLRSADLPAQVTGKSLGKHLGISARHLRRKLQDEQTNLAQLIDTVLQERSHDLLISSGSVQETAYLLGYFHASSFQRAFRRWFGITPSEYRRRAASKPVAG